MFRAKYHINLGTEAVISRDMGFLKSSTLTASGDSPTTSISPISLIKPRSLAASLVNTSHGLYPMMLLVMTSSANESLLAKTSPRCRGSPFEGPLPSIAMIESMTTRLGFMTLYRSSSILAKFSLVSNFIWKRALL